MIRAWKLSKTANRSNAFSKKTKQPVALLCVEHCQFTKVKHTCTITLNLCMIVEVCDCSQVIVVCNFLLNNTFLPYSIIRLRRNWSSGEFACSEYSKLLPQTFAHLHSELNEAAKRSRLSRRGEKGRDAT